MKNYVMIFHYNNFCTQLPPPPIYKKVSWIRRYTPLLVTVVKSLFSL